MRLLIKRAKIIDSKSSQNGKILDLLIVNGKIERIGRNIDDSKAKIFAYKGIHVSPGWLDIGTQLGEPGFEHREDLKSGLAAAAAGGFTDIACFPNTFPVLHSKSEIQFIKNNTSNTIVNVHPIGAISQRCEGNDITEMLDMEDSGAIAYSDGRNSVANSNLLLLALLYSKGIDKPIIHIPKDKNLAFEGLMHEGEVSTSLGTTGIPTLAEEVCVSRDCRLNEYAQSQLVEHLISCKESVAIIKAEKKKQSGLHSTVSYLNLVEDQSSLMGFDPSFKVLPPLRDKSDQSALIRGIKDNTIDAICTNHEPVEPEIKDKEFAYAAFGSIGLETCFAALNTFTRNKIGLELIIDKLSHGPRSILGFDDLKVQEGQDATLTLFDPDKEWIFDKSIKKSKSGNTPYLNTTFLGAAIGVINKGKVWINDQLV